MEANKEKKMIRIDRMDSYIVRFREDIRLQEQLERKRRSTFLSLFLKKCKLY